jgi:hypothetical protein
VAAPGAAGYPEPPLGSLAAALVASAFAIIEWQSPERRAYRAALEKCETTIRSSFPDPYAVKVGKARLVKHPDVLDLRWSREQLQAPRRDGGLGNLAARCVVSYETGEVLSFELL